MTPNPNHLCPVCNQVMEDGVQQPLYPGMKPLSLSHCTNPNCSLEGATLATGKHETLTVEQIAAYGCSKPAAYGRGKRSSR